MNDLWEGSEHYQMAKKNIVAQAAHYGKISKFDYNYVFSTYIDYMCERGELVKVDGEHYALPENAGKK